VWAENTAGNDLRSYLVEHLGHCEPCQIRIFLGDASATGSFLDRNRRTEAGVSDTAAFATKPQLARQKLAGAFVAGVPGPG